MVSAVTGNNADLLAAVTRLWITPGDVVVDATYGRGAFWTKTPSLPTYAFDAKTGHDLRALPLPDASVDVLALDPPYRPTHGSKSFGNVLADAYALGTTNLDTINDVLALYRDGIQEAARVLRNGGRILVKTQDISYANRLHLVSLDVLRLLTDCGFALADQFVLTNSTRLGSTKWVRQERARRSHSVLWVAWAPER